jgi:hypothetical protein
MRNNSAPDWSFGSTTHKAMDARLQRRIQRYGWDLAADDYEPLWQAQLAEAQDKLFEEITTCFQAYVMLF